LVQQQTIIDSQVTELTGVQRERGMNVMLEGKERKDNDDDDDNHPDDIASRKKSLEEQSATVQIEIMKLNTERDNREKRVQGKFTNERLIRFDDEKLMRMESRVNICIYLLLRY